MLVTYLSHSGFLIETGSSYLLFDYESGQIPELDQKKALFIFASHKHQDHYNPLIFTIGRKHGKTKYILSKDIPHSAAYCARHNIDAQQLESVVRVRKRETYKIKAAEAEIEVETLRSTDLGVAFLVCAEGKWIYHAGDLNLWIWPGESSEANENMKQQFEKEISLLQGKDLLAAFLVLDPRQEEFAFPAMDACRKAISAKYIFPMHFWKEYEIIQTYQQHCLERGDIDTIITITEEGQQYEI